MNRERLFWTIAAAAGYRSALAIQHATGIDRKTLRHALRGRPVRLATLERLAAGLGVPPLALAGIIETRARRA